DMCTVGDLMSPRLKLKRFKVTVPSDEVLAFYTRFYGNRELYFAPESLPPINAKELFGIDAPLVFDLGCGRGDFLIREAAESPDQYFVGIELHWKSIWDAVNKAHQAGLRNVRFLRADAQRVLAKVADGDVSEVFLLFPPPLKQQFFDLPTLRQVQRILCE